jgi:hypothetical protein
MRSAMFPLRSVVFPYTAVPLRVFEPRYQTLVDSVMRGDRSFGTVLIERGGEVGGGDTRFSVGTRVRIVNVSQPSGSEDRMLLVAGMERIRVLEWLADDPHPWAMVEPLPDREERVGDLVAEVRHRLQKVMLYASELGIDVAQIDLNVVDDSLPASYQLAALCPVGPLDGQRMLEASGPRARLELAADLLELRAELLVAQMGGG